MLDFTKSGEEIEIAGACQDVDAQLLDIEWINEWDKKGTKNSYINSKMENAYNKKKKHENLTKKTKRTKHKQTKEENKQKLI